METVSKSLIDYQRPPIVEVVCGVLFDPITSLLVPHFGLLWEKYKSEYPNCHEVAPLAPVVEVFEGKPKVQIEIGEVPPLPRIWFVSEKENALIQVQRDRFLHNWRKIRPDDEYPRYSGVIKEFRESLSLFEIFLEQYRLGGLIPTQYEMTYVNHIPHGEGWEKIEEIGKVFPDFAFRVSNGRFLPLPEGINWRTSFLLPDQSGRLHVTIRRGAQRDKDLPMLLLDLTVRGIGQFKSRERMWEWFDIAHQWIVFGFADLTGKEVQKEIWKRQD